MSEQSSEVTYLPQSKKNKPKNSPSKHSDLLNSKISQTIRSQESTIRKNERWLDFDKVAALVLGKAPSKDLISMIENRNDSYTTVKRAETVLKDVELKEGSIGCDLETAIGEAIDDISGQENVIVKIKNVRGVKIFDKNNIDALVFVYFNGEHQKSIPLSIKIIPTDYNRQMIRTQADYLFEPPGDTISRNDFENGEYWKSIEKSGREIAEFIIQRKKQIEDNKSPYSVRY